MTTEQQATRLMLLLRARFGEARKETRAILIGASKILVSEVKSRTPVGSRVHSRYSKRSAGRAARGAGTKVATYRPGNLRASFRTLTFSRAKSAVFVGAKIAKGKSSKPDGYYAHMVERGTSKMSASPFVAPAVRAVGNEVQHEIIRRLQAILK